MNRIRSIFTLAVVSALSVSLSAQAVDFSDSKGDDNGPGSYTYPTDGVYKPGSFDLTKLSVNKKGDQVEFAVETNSRLEDPWGMGVGFAVQMAYVFVKNQDGGYADVPTGLNVQFAKGHEWNKAIILSPQKKGRVMGEVSGKAGKMANDILVPNSTTGSNRSIKGSIPLKDLGGDGNIDAWKYQVVMQSNEGFPDTDSLLARKVNEYEGQHRWGGGHDGNCDPHVMDVLESASVTQKQQLAYECGPNGESVKKATLQMFNK
jgi:carbohydrate-binding DOMON domain-containing protein